MANENKSNPLLDEGMSNRIVFPAKPVSIVPILILGAFFFIFGFVTWLNGTLIQYLKIACELSFTESTLVASAFYISYFVMAVPSSYVLKLTGFKNGMSLGLFIMAGGAILFIPAAETRNFNLFLTGLFIIGTGLSILQTASNPYVTIVGSINSAAKRISIMGICNKVAGVLAPIILSAVVLSDADSLIKSLTVMDEAQKNNQLDELASRVILPYSIMAAVLAALGILVRFSPLPEIEEENESIVEADSLNLNTNVFQFPHLILGVIALFFYVGAEVLAGDTIGSYGQSQGIPLSEAKYFTAFTLSAMVIGYIIGIFSIPKFISQSKALAYSAIAGIIFSTGVLFTHGYISVLFVALLGLANALVWPAIWPLAISGLGKFTKTGSALLIMAIAGGAVFPYLYGNLAEIDFIGYHQAYLLLVPCYLFILFYSVKGYKYSKW